jgi:uncharacterized protein (DUF1800 family)
MARLLRLCGWLLLVCAVPASAHVYDHLYGSGFEVVTDLPASDKEAARFLTQATFGPTVAEIAKVRQLGYSEYLAQQMGKPVTLERPTVESVINARSTGGQGIGQTQRYNRWFWVAAYGEDQVRQRMAWALSQIFVISDQNGAISQDYIPMTEYYDILARDAFDRYRVLLGDVTFNPTMGKYLSHFRNRKHSSSTEPDENYAREVMQLFSVGLIQRNSDFSPVLQSGNPIATYDQTTVTETAKVFTGFTYSDAPVGSAPLHNGANFFSGGSTTEAEYAPMACWGSELFPVSGSNNGSQFMYHDVSTKTVLAGIVLPINQSCHDDVNGALDNIAGHMNVAPFIARQLIQRFVTSNPSPQYIARVAAKFEDNGLSDHERGDLGAVLRAILLDTEARTAPASATAGKLREPLLRLTALWRAWGTQPQPADAYGEVKMVGNVNFLTSFGERPLSSATVFNFYEPDYQQPGALVNLYAPEFQITNESTVYNYANGMYAFSAQAFVGMTGTVPTDRPLMVLTELSTLAHSGNYQAMVDLANARMLYGSMSASMNTYLFSMLDNMSGASDLERAWSLAYIVAISPEYAAQR